MRRHKNGHIPPALAKASDAAEVAHGDDLLAEMRKLQQITLALLARAVKADDIRTALSAVREARGNLEMLGRLIGELEPQTVNVHLTPDWLSLRGFILQALGPYPDARLALADALPKIESDAGD